jgi:hypothetical protein
MGSNAHTGEGTRLDDLHTGFASNTSGETEAVTHHKTVIDDCVFAQGIIETAWVATKGLEKCRQAMPTVSQFPPAQSTTGEHNGSILFERF